MFRQRNFYFTKMFRQRNFCFGKMFRQRKFYQQKKLGSHIHDYRVDYFLFLVSLSRQSLWVLRHRQYFGIAQQPEPTTNSAQISFQQNVPPAQISPNTKKLGSAKSLSNCL